MSMSLHSHVDGKCKDHVRHIWRMHSTNMYQAPWPSEGLRQSRMGQFCVVEPHAIWKAQLPLGLCSSIILSSSFFPSLLPETLTEHLIHPFNSSLQCSDNRDIYRLACFIMTSERGEEEVDVVSWYPIACGWSSKLNFTWIYQLHKYNSGLVLSLEETGVTRLSTIGNTSLI